MKELLRKIVDDMAQAGWNSFYEDSWESEEQEDLIEREMWREIMVKALQSIKFPAELYQAIEYLTFMGDDDVYKELIANKKVEGV
jgi:hypothetical protein